MIHPHRSQTWMRVAGSAAALLMGASAAQASVEISAAATKNMSCSAGVCSPTAKKAVLNVNDLTNMLATGDVKVTTGAGAVTITIAAPFSWTSTHRLTLDAYYNVSFKAPVTVAGQGAVTITYNDGGSGGDLLFFPGAKLDFWDLSSKLIISRKKYTLVSDIKNLAGDAAADPSGLFAFARDYDASADGQYADSPITTPLAGTLDGLGHAVSNLDIRSEKQCLGLISTVLHKAVVQNISLLNVKLASIQQHRNVGALAACNAGKIANAFASGTVSAYKLGHFGGLVGQNDGLVIDSSADVSVGGSSKSKIGGLVGYNSGTVLKSSAEGTVGGEESSSVGGLVGYSASSGSISFSHATGSVSAGPYSSAGGLAGAAEMVEQSYATGAVQVFEGFDYWTSAGGLLGGGSAQDCYATGSVQGDGMITLGGLVGAGSAVSTSYSLGAVTGRAEVAGGFIGTNYTTALSKDYWDRDTSGLTEGCGKGDCSGVRDMTDAELKSELPKGFDPKIWGQSPNINNGYPYLLANPPPQ